MTVMPPAIAGGKFLVDYTIDASSNFVKDVWILTVDEAAAVVVGALSTLLSTGGSP